MAEKLLNTTEKIEPRCLVCGLYFEKNDEVTRVFQGRLRTKADEMLYWGGLHTSCFHKHVAIPKAALEYFKKLEVDNEIRRREKAAEEVLPAEELSMPIEALL